MINLSSFSNAELALCADEFVRRSIDVVRAVGINSQIVVVRIEACQYNDKAEYTIDHHLTIDPYSKPSTSKTNNLCKSAQHAASRWIEDAIDPPTTVRPMLTHQKETEDEAIVQEEAEEAVFTDVQSVPFPPDDEDA